MHYEREHTWVYGFFCNSALLSGALLTMQKEPFIQKDAFIQKPYGLFTQWITKMGHIWMYGSFCRKRPMSLGFFDGKRLLVYTRHHVTNKVRCLQLYFFTKEPPFSRMPKKTLWSGGLSLFLFRGCQKKFNQGTFDRKAHICFVTSRMMFCDYRTLFPPKRPYILELFRRQEANKIRFAMLQIEFMVTELCLQREPFFGKRALSFWALFTQIGLFSYILVFFHTCRSLLLYMVSFHTCRSLLFTHVGLFWYIQVSFRTYRSLFIHVRLYVIETQH